MTPPKKTSAEVRAQHRAHVFPSGTHDYDESVDLDGRTYLDFFGGILTVSVGHANPRVNAAVIAQVQRLGHVSGTASRDARS